MKYIIVVGNPIDGYNFFGPFETTDDAIRFHDDHLDYGEHWEVAKLKAPNDEATDK